ncbi:MAG: signal peptidase II [bacterium]
MGIIVMAVLILALDQVTKLWVQNSMVPQESIPLLPGIFHLTYVQNTGAAFGIMKGKTLFFVIITAVVVGFVLYIIPQITKGQLQLRLAMGLLLGGAVGNLIDRVRFGYVIDFFDFRIWPVFNIADSAVVVGVALLFWFILFKQLEGL